MLDGESSMTRVLVVDNDAGIRSIVAELLEDEGYTVDTTDDGAQDTPTCP